MADDDLAKFHRPSRSTDEGEYRTRRLVDLVLLLVIGLPLMLGAMALLGHMHELQCPAGTFLTDTLRPDYESLGMFGAVLGTTALIRLWLTDHWTGLREQLRPDNPNKKTPRWAYKLAVAAIIIGTPISAWASLCRFCATPQGLTYRVEPEKAEHSYSWNRVIAIATSCSQGGRGSWHTRAETH